MAKMPSSQGIIHRKRTMKLFGNMLAVTDGEGNVLETYTHGADFSGGVGGGAGGIGGILASTQASGPAYYHYDFNGNVVNVSSSTQTQLARYTYSPFGEVLLKEGAFSSRYQFSTKEYDTCTGLNYYGYRFYSPALGRWINRDPIGERGGVNLFAFVLNSPVGQVDYLGLLSCPDKIEDTCMGGFKVTLAKTSDEKWTEKQCGGKKLKCHACTWSGSLTVEDAIKQGYKASPSTDPSHVLCEKSKYEKECK